jgi:hypothetical protein
MRIALIVAALPCLVLGLALQAAEPGIDAAYLAEHDGWETRCVEQLAERKGASCLIGHRDEASGLALFFVVFPLQDETRGELWLAMPEGLDHEDLPGVLDVQLQAAADDAPKKLQGQPIELDGGSATYLLLAQPDEVESLALTKPSVSLEVDLGGEAPLEAGFDLAGAAAAWNAVQSHHGWK